MASPLWVRELLSRGVPMARPLARLTRLPLLGRLVERGLFDEDDIVILPTDRVIPINRDIEPLEHQVLPSQVVEHFLRRASFIWRMDRCICRDGEGCRDYPRDLGCLFLGEAARDINRSLGREVTTDEALEHVAQCREAGLVHLIGRNKLDALWLNVAPASRLLTICNCCPCCCLWRILPSVTDRIAEKVTRLPGVALQVDRDCCVGCGTCCAPGACFTDAIALSDTEGVAVISDDCRGCGRCVTRCPEGAITIEYDGGESIAALIERLEQTVDVG